MAGPADALQAAGHRGRCLHLDHQVDGPHVDTQFQARGGHHRLEQSAFEVLLDQGALLLADRTVVGAGQYGVRSVGLPAAHDVRRRPTGHPPIGLGREFDTATIGVNFVEPCGKSLGQPSRIGEHDGRAVCFDQVDQASLDVGPDGVVRQVGHVGHRHLHGELERLGRRGSHDRGRGVSGQEPRELLGWTHRRRQSDALGGPPVPEVVEPLQRHRQVCAALAGGDGVNLVDDHGLHAGQGFARGRGQHQEQRLGGGDQHVGWGGDELAAARGRGVAGADPDTDVGGPRPCRSAIRVSPANGVRRLRSTSTASALSGDT